MSYPNKELLFIIRSQENSIIKLIKQNYEREDLFPNLSAAGFHLLKEYLKSQELLCKDILILSKSMTMFLLNLYQHSKNSLKLNQDMLLLQNLLRALDHIFKHGLKYKTTFLGYKRSYFDMFYEFFIYHNKSTIEPYKKIVEDIYNRNLTGSAAGLALFSLFLNEKVLYDALELLSMNEIFVRDWYEPYAFLNTNHVQLFLTLLATLKTMPFCIDFNESFFIQQGEKYENVIVETEFKSWIDEIMNSINAVLNSDDDSSSEESVVEKEVKEDIKVKKELTFEAPPSENLENSYKMDNEDREVTSEYIKSNKDFDSTDIILSENSDQEVKLNQSTDEISQNLVEMNLESSINNKILNEIDGPKGEIGNSLKEEETAEGNDFSTENESFKETLDQEKENDNLSTEGDEELSYPNSQMDLKLESSSDPTPTLEQFKKCELEKEELKRVNETLKEEIKLLKKNEMGYLEEIAHYQMHQQNLQNNIEENQRIIKNLELRIKESELTQEEYQTRFLELGNQLAFVIGEKARQQEQFNQFTINSNLLKKKNQELQDNLHQSIKDKQQLQELLSNSQLEYKELNKNYNNLKTLNQEKEHLLQVLANEMAKSKLDLKELSLKQQQEKQIRDDIHHWVDDALALQCTKCNTPFSLIVRKHHCRRDGKVYCGSCTSYRAILPASRKFKRVCKDCYLLLKQEGNVVSPENIKE